MVSRQACFVGPAIGSQPGAGAPVLHHSIPPSWICSGMWIASQLGILKTSFNVKRSPKALRNNFSSRAGMSSTSPCRIPSRAVRSDISQRTEFLCLEDCSICWYTIFFISLISSSPSLTLDHFTVPVLSQKPKSTLPSFQTTKAEHIPILSL